MPYYTGAANSMAGLLESVTTACVAEGWTWADSILSKGDVFVQLTASETSTPYIQATAGAGKTEGVLDNPSAAKPALSRISTNSSFEDINYPCTYHLFVFDKPDEVYLVVQYGVDWHAWLAFGHSIIDGTSIWISGCRPSSLHGSSGIIINSGGGASSSYFWACGAIFWATNSYSSDYFNCDLLLGNEWIAPNGRHNRYSNGMLAASPIFSQLIDRGLSAWNNESVLIPIQPHLRVDGDKIQMLADIQNARYIRVDNYDSGQILTIGSEQWMVFPFIRKNTAARDGGNSINHTGTFGWAIRYDGDN